MSSETNIQLFPGVFRSTVGGTNPGFFLHSDGRVGIGNTAPEDRPAWDTDPASTAKNKLNVTGHTHITGSLNVTGHLYGDGSTLSGVAAVVGGYWDLDQANNNIKYDVGNVGIGGAASSTNELKVHGTVEATDLTVSGDIRLNSTGTAKIFNHFTGSDYGNLQISSGYQNAAAAPKIDLIGYTGAGTVDGDNLIKFSTNNSVRMFINQSGNVGIGGDPGTEKLKVHGDILATANVTAYSDRRLKSDIVKIKDALNKIDKLNGYTYTMNDKRSTGLIAQEVLEVLPEAVEGSEETTYALAYGNLASIFVEAIKELREKVLDLENKIQN